MDNHGIIHLNRKQTQKQKTEKFAIITFPILNLHNSILNISPLYLHRCLPSVGRLGSAFAFTLLLCTPSKIFERLILDKVLPLFPVDSFQHGFKSLLSTSTLLTTVSQSVFKGLNHGKPALRSLVAAIDISKAFDTVSWYKLISKMLDAQLQPNYKRWL